MFVTCSWAVRDFAINNALFYTEMVLVIEIDIVVKDEDTFILQSQYHSCWWPGDPRSQVISSHAIDLIIPDILLSVPERVKGWL